MGGGVFGGAELTGAIVDRSESCKLHLSSAKCAYLDNQLTIGQSDFMKIRVTATKASRQFSEILDRVAYQGETFVVERAGRPICEISPTASEGIPTRELVNLLRSSPRPDKAYFKTLEKITRKQAPVAPSPWER